MSELMRLMQECHNKCCERPNASSYILYTSLTSSCDSKSAIISAIASLGGSHAPIKEAYGMLCDTDDDIIKKCQEIIDKKWTVAGFGSDFVKGRRDEIFNDVDVYLSENYPIIHRKIELINSVLHNNGKNVYPNAAIYTAATAIAEKYTQQSSMALLIKLRIDGWTRTIDLYLKEGKALFEED